MRLSRGPQEIIYQESSHFEGEHVKWLFSLLYHFFLTIYICAYLFLRNCPKINNCSHQDRERERERALDSEGEREREARFG